MRVLRSEARCEITPDSGHAPIVCKKMRSGIPEFGKAIQDGGVQNVSQAFAAVRFERSHHMHLSGRAITARFGPRAGAGNRDAIVGDDEEEIVWGKARISAELVLEAFLRPPRADIPLHNIAPALVVTRSIRPKRVAVRS